MLLVHEADDLRARWLDAARRLSYADYLRTEHWAFFRAELIRRAGGRCQLCGSDDRLEVHHNSYARLGCERESDCAVLCEDCHGLLHDLRPVRED